jgi:hypothetical protein
MVNEKLIEKFLNKNCSIHLSDKTVLINNFNPKKYDISNYLTFLVKLFPEITFNTERVFFKWYDNELATIENNLNTFYSNYKIKKGIDVLIDDALIFFKEKHSNITKEYIVDRYSYRYINDIIVPELGIYMNKYPNDTSLQLLKRTTKKFKAFNEITATHIKDKVLNYYKKIIIPNKIKLYLEQMDLTLGSKRLMMDINITFKHDKKYFSGDIIDSFKKYYRENYLLSKLNNFLDSKIQSEIRNFSYLKADYGDLLIEIDTEEEFCINTINEWYLDNKLKPKLEDLFSQLVITMGSKNWVVTWIGHGPLDENKIIKGLNEDEFNREYIINKYDEWYTEAVILASERALSRNDFNLYGNVHF